MAKKAKNASKKEETSVAIISSKTEKKSIAKKGKFAKKEKKVFAPTIIIDESAVNKQIAKADLVSNSKSKVKEYFQLCLKRSVKDNVKSALVNMAKGGASILQADLELVAVGGTLRKEAGNDPDSLLQAKAEFKGILAHFKSSASKKIMAVIFPTREAFSQMKFDLFSNYMVENQAGIASTHKELCESANKGSRSAKLPGSGSGNRRTKGIAIPDTEPVVTWTIKYFGEGDESAAKCILTALATLQQLLNGEVSLEEVREDLSVVFIDDKDTLNDDMEEGDEKAGEETSEDDDDEESEDDDDEESEDDDDE